MERIRREGQNFFEVVAPQEEEEEVVLHAFMVCTEPSLFSLPFTYLNKETTDDKLSTPVSTHTHTH